jgi:hypothetical protein
MRCETAARQLDGRKRLLVCGTEALGVGEGLFRLGGTACLLEGESEIGSEVGVFKRKLDGFGECITGFGIASQFLISRGKISLRF